MRFFQTSQNPNKMQSKVCSKCNNECKLSNFYKHNGGKHGVDSICKKCSNEICLKYQRSKRGIISRIYSNQRRGTRVAGYNEIPYTSQELYEFAIGLDNFDQLYNNWVMSGYDSEIAPSFDRINDYKGYSFENIKLVRWHENRSRAHSDAIMGINRKACRAVFQCDLDGNIINEFFSLHEAERVTGISIGHICNVCKGDRNHAGGFIWKYKYDKFK